MMSIIPSSVTDAYVDWLLKNPHLAQQVRLGTEAEALLLVLPDLPCLPSACRVHRVHATPRTRVVSAHQVYKHICAVIGAF